MTKNFLTTLMLAALVSTAAAMSAHAEYQQNCQTTRDSAGGSHSVCTNSYVTPPPFYPATREDVVVRHADPVAGESAPADNFCGAGYRMTAEGCSPR